jgi:outer membrane protein assembly factor BamB
MRMRHAVLLSVSLAALALAGCESLTDMVTPSEGPPLPGKRETVLKSNNALRADPALASVAVTLPVPVANAEWAQRGGNPEHSLGHVALGASPREAFRASIGSGATSARALLGVPVVAGGRIYGVDSDSNATALDARTGAKIWSVSLAPEKTRSDAMGGGAAYADGRVYATTGYGEVLALDPANGSVIWRKRLSGPVRGAPTIAGGRVYAVTLDNQLFALTADKGETVWSHGGIQESADVLGSASPAVSGSLVVAPYSSGEVFGLRADNGRVIWQDSLSALRSADSMTNLAAIRGLPVIDHGLIFAISHSGRMVAVDERSGSRVWEVALGGTQTPYVAGDYVFAVSTEGELAAIARKDGRVRWLVELPRFEKPDSRKNPIQWAGPVVAGGRLWLTNSKGELWAVSPEDGRELGRLPLPSRTYLPPFVAENTLYVLSDNGSLTAFR